MTMRLGKLVAGSLVAVFALINTAALSKPAETNGDRWLTPDILSSAVQLIEAYQYKPMNAESAALRIREAALKLSKDPPAKFEQCFDESLKRSRLKTALSVAVDSAVRCLHLESADIETQNKASAALFLAIAASSDNKLQLLSPGLPRGPFDSGARTAPPPPSGGGIGLDLMDVADGKQVVGSRYSSPARELGIAPEDVIVAIDGRSAVTMTLDEAVLALQGTPDSSVALRLKAKDGALERTVVLRRKAMSSLNERIITQRSDRLLIVDIRSMEGGESTLIEQAWSDKGKDAKGLVIDLRLNEGGTLDEAVSLADALLDKGIITTIEARSAVDRQVFNANRGAIAQQVPIVVLIGPRTAAGAEILAAALHDNHRAILVGQRSFGRGTIESLFYLRMQPKVPLTITTGEALRSDGSSFDKLGLSPDCATQASGAALIEIARAIVAGGLAACPAN